MRKPPAVHEIRDPRALAALTAPVRQEILDALSARTPLSVGDLALGLGRSRHALYYHLRALVRVGLAVEAGRRRAGRRFEALYLLPALRLRIVYDLDSPAFRRQMSRIAGGMFRLTNREFARALSDPESRGEGPRPNLYAGRVAGRLTPAQLGVVNRMIRRLFDYMNRNRRPGGDRIHAITLALLSMPAGSRSTRKRRRRSRP